MSGGFLFWFFAAVACFGAVAVVVSQSVSRMAVWLIVALGGAAGLFFNLHADFVGATQLLIYVGGTIVLLIFGVMLTASGPYMRIRTSPGEGFLAAGVGMCLLFVVYATAISVDWNYAKASLLEKSELTRLVREINSDEFATVLHNEGLEKSDETLLRRIYDIPEVVSKKPDGTVEEPSESETIRPCLLKPAEQPSRAEMLRVVNLFSLRVDVAGAPHTREGGTLRPLGLAFAGLRPDRDMGAAQKARWATNSPGYLLPFEIVSVHLLVVLVGAAYLARAKRRQAVPEDVVPS